MIAKWKDILLSTLYICYKVIAKWRDILLSTNMSKPVSMPLGLRILT